MNRYLDELSKKGQGRLFPSIPSIAVGMGTCGIGNGAAEVFQAFKEQIETQNLAIQLREVGCFGFCSEEPLVTIQYTGKPLLMLKAVSPDDVPSIMDAVTKALPPTQNVLCKISSWDHHLSLSEFGQGYEAIPEWNEIDYFKAQKKLVLRNAGLIDPASLAEYVAVGGYSAFFKAVWEMDREQVLFEVKDSKLRGRGGAGFPTGLKWELMSKEPSDRKILICNADEGDPGAYMNRNEMESDPHMLIEGMMIAAYATRATEGLIYVRAEYPLAVQRVKNAIDQARQAGLLASQIEGTLFQFDLTVVEGAGAFVCGEETALIASVEGNAGRPRIKPPFPAQSGYLGYPTTINNLETWCNVPLIVAKGSSWFRKVGKPDSPGTKVFSLVGKVKHTGLVELPLGEKLTTLVYEIGGGAIKDSKKIKAVQSGGPSGGCIPAHLFDTSIDYESLVSLGSIMGSGGMVVMDQDNCMVDVARYFLEFTTSESCGKCVPCREGLPQQLRILNKIASGNGELSDLDLMEELALNICDTALCGLGQSAPNPVLTTLKYFHQEYEQHILQHCCNSGTCEELITALCSNSCPMHMDIPAYLQLLKENRLEEAFEATLQDNPLPGTIGRICHFHCQMRCRRESLDEPVHQGEIHRYLADTMYKMGREEQIYKAMIENKLKPTGKKIAIIGAGPAGLTAAFYLIRLGHEVVVFDENSQAGGVLRYGIPSYRLPKDVLDKELELFTRLGIEFHFGQRLGGEIDLETLRAAFDGVILAMGSYQHMELTLDGSNLKGVVQGTEILKQLEQEQVLALGQKVAIIGGGNVAIDVARSLWRLGKGVTIVYRRGLDEMPANKTEIEEAQAEGIEFRLFTSPFGILSTTEGSVCGLRLEKMSCGPYDLSGRRKPISSGVFETLSCDTVVLAIGEKVDGALLVAEGVALDERGNAFVHPNTMATDLKKVWAIGDVVSGPSTAAQAMGQAKLAAQMIDFALTGKNRFTSLMKNFSYSQEVPQDNEKQKPIAPRHLAMNKRKGNFEEVNRGYLGQQAIAEASRCLRCDIRHQEVYHG